MSPNSIVVIVNPLSILRKTIRFRFDIFAMLTMCEILKVELHELSTIADEKKMLIVWLYGAYVSDCRYNAKRERYSLENIYTMYAKMTTSDVEKIKIAMLTSNVMGKSMLEWAKSKDEEKKN